jgi:hypothetical protein
MWRSSRTKAFLRLGKGRLSAKLGDGCIEVVLRADRNERIGAEARSPLCGTPSREVDIALDPGRKLKLNESSRMTMAWTKTEIVAAMPVWVFPETTKGALPHRAAQS